MSRGTTTRKVRIYEPDAEPVDVGLSQALRMAGHNVIYFHNDSPRALDTGWYLRPGVSWKEARSLAQWPNLEGICQVAMGLLSDEGENLEYDRALGEMLTELLGLPLGDGQPQRIIEAMRHIRDDEPIYA